MLKVLFIITVFGLCHAYTDKPETEEYTDADVNSPLVLEKAQLALKLSAQYSARRCTDATVVRVTKARHRLQYRWPWSGTQYEINMIIRTSKGKEKTCETRLWQPTGKDTYNTDNTAATLLCDCSDKTAN